MVKFYTNQLKVVSLLTNALQVVKKLFPKCALLRCIGQHFKHNFDENGWSTLVLSSLIFLTYCTLIQIHDDDYSEVYLPVELNVAVKPL